MDILSAWLLIVGCVVLFAAVFAPAAIIVAAGNRDRIRELMDAHEKNLKSDDPVVVASSKERWAKMCEFIKKDHRNYKTGVLLEQFGLAAEQMFCRPTFPEAVDDCVFSAEEIRAVQCGANALRVAATRVASYGDSRDMELMADRIEAMLNRMGGVQ